MSLMNGLTAARILKETIPETYLLLFTAFGTLLTTDQLKCAGFSASISKADAGKLISTAQTLVKAA